MLASALQMSYSLTGLLPHLGRPTRLHLARAALCALCSRIYSHCSYFLISAACACMRALDWRAFMAGKQGKGSACMTDCVAGCRHSLSHIGPALLQGEGSSGGALHLANAGQVFIVPAAAAAAAAAPGEREQWRYKTMKSWTAPGRHA